MDATKKKIPSDATAARRRWLGVLAKASAAELAAAWEAIEDKPGHRWLRRPETGMIMARGRIGGTGQAFNLGEVSVVRCALEIDGGTVGLCYAHGRGHGHAEHAALFDALLQLSHRRDDVERQVIAPLEAAHSQKREQRGREAAATRVEFFTVVRGEDGMDGGSSS